MKMKKLMALITVFCVLVTSTGVTSFAETGAITVDTTDTVNQGKILATETLEPGQIRTAKTVEDIGQGEFEITLQAIGRRFEEKVISEKPVCYDVVFVLDYSASMDGTKLSNMKAAATQSINSILANNTGTYYNRVAVVKYADGAKVLKNWMSGTSMQGNIDDQTQSRTNTMAGMNQAYKLLSDRTGDSASRPAIIILMSDGQPNGYYKDFTNHSYMTTSGQQITSNGANADATSVYNTIRCIADIKKNMSGNTASGIAALQIYSIGFDLDKLAGETGKPATQQKEYAYASLYPSKANLDIQNMSGVKALFPKGEYDKFENPVSEFLTAGADLSAITKAFTTIIESIVYNDPISGNIELFDTIDSNFEIVADSFNDGEKMPSTVTVTKDGLLKWSFKNLETLASTEALINDHPISTLTFKVKLKESAKVQGNLDKILYTNTANFGMSDASNPNYAHFSPLSQNPYYYAKNGEKLNGTNADGYVRQNLLSTGEVTLTLGKFNVYYRYFVDGVQVNPTDKLYNAAYEGLADAAAYSIQDKVVDYYDGASFLIAGKHMESLLHSDITAIEYENVLETAQAYAAGTIDNKDVYFDLYYITDNTNITLGKTIVKRTDETWPNNFTFLFTLKDGGTTVATMTMDESSFILSGNRASATGKFVPVEGVKFTDLLGKTLTLHEEFTPKGNPGDWSPEFVQDADYVKISETGSITYLLNSGSVTNIYRQTPVRAEIPVEKYFTADMENFNLYPGFDGSEHVCKYCDEAQGGIHKHSDACDVLTCTLEENHVHTDDCILTDEEGPILVDGEPQYICGQEEGHVHSDSCFERKCELKDITDEELAEHVCNDECYTYTFKFELKSGRDTIDTQYIVLTAAQLKQKLETGEFVDDSIVFSIAPSLLGDETKTFRIVETSDVVGWNLSAVKWFRVNRLGEVIFSDEGNKVTMHNDFDSLQAPEFTVFKDVLDGRTGDIAANYNGSFKFVLKDGDTEVKTFDIDVKNGQGFYPVKLPEYLEKEANLTLTEIRSDAAGVQYDTREYNVAIAADGSVTITLNGVEGGAIFQNTYMEDITPSILIQKSTNGKNKNGTFKFAITLEGEGTVYVEIKTVSGSGEYRYELPVNFDGGVTVTEVPDWVDNDNANTDNWNFDTNEFMYYFNKGVLVESYADIAHFQNDNHVPEIDLIKSASAKSVNVNGKVTYTLTAMNNGTDEDLTNVTITDSMLKGYVGEIKVTKINVGGSTVLAAGKDYSFSSEEGIISLTDNLLKGEMVIVTYEIEFKETGSFKNEATVNGNGEISGIAVSDEDDKTVTVTKDRDPGDPPTRGRETTTTDTPSTPDTTIENPDVPLATLPDSPVTITEEDVPLGDIPQTDASGDLAINIAMLGLSLGAAMALLIGRKREDEAK